MVVLRTGNIDDPTTGLADLVGEMLKEGAGGRSAADVARLAADMGGSLDVGVGPDQTTVSLDVLGERAPDAIALAADVLRRPALPAGELPRLKANVARQVAVARSSPQAIAGEAYARLLWGDHPYGRALPTDAEIESYSIDGVRGFVAKNFGAARAHVYVGGRFDRAAAEAAVRAAFADWAPGAPPTVAPPTGMRTAQVELIDRADAAQSTILLGGPTIGPTSPDYLPLVVTNTLLGGGLISRLDQNLREDKGWTYGVATRISAYYRAAAWTMSADVNTPDTAPALRETYREIARLQAEPPSAAELQRIQNYRAGTFVIGASSRGGLLGQLAFLNLHGLPDEWLTDYVKNVYAVTPEQVSAATRTHLDPNRMTLVVVGDERKIGADVSALPQVKAASRK
jgi:predicted Zn-dependent peptidase